VQQCGKEVLSLSPSFNDALGAMVGGKRVNKNGNSDCEPHRGKYASMVILFPVGVARKNSFVQTFQAGSARINSINMCEYI
jgi:hypothetical protein